MKIEKLVLHIPVLKKEVLELLDPRPDENFVDATVNGGGYAMSILEKTAPNGKILAFDLDEKVLEKFKEKARTEGLEERIVPIPENFAEIQGVVGEKSFGPVDGIVADLGFSSWQIEKSGRGFSFLRDEPLLMNFNESSSKTAEQIVNEASEEEIIKILREYGEERFAPSIARHLVGARKIKKIQTTFELVEVIKKSMPFRFQRGKIHPATRTFQALRIAVNDELGNLKKLLADGFEVLSDGGRFAIVSFHSLEDRIVKNFFREKKAEGQGEILTKKPITPGEAEISENPRSRSAKLRAIKKLKI